MFDKTCINQCFFGKKWQLFCKKMTYMLDFSTFLNYTFRVNRGKKMIDIYDSEALIKIYRLLRKKCDAIDKFIQNHALYFGPCTAEYGALDVCNNIIELMTRKNQLINLKIIIDKAISTLNEKDKKILFIKMNYNLHMSEICGILDLKERTAFRRIEKAFEHLADALNESKYCGKLIKIMQNEEWIQDIKEEVKDRRLAFKCVAEC